MFVTVSFCGGGVKEYFPCTDELEKTGRTKITLASKSLCLKSNENIQVQRYL